MLEVDPTRTSSRSRERRDPVSPFSLASRFLSIAVAAAISAVLTAASARAQESPRLVGVEVEGTTLLDPERVADVTLTVRGATQVSAP